jgi:hypothetical protein
MKGNRKTLKHVHVDEKLANGGGRRRPEKRERTRRWCVGRRFGD